MTEPLRTPPRGVQPRLERSDALERVERPRQTADDLQDRAHVVAGERGEPQRRHLGAARGELTKRMIQDDLRRPIRRIPRSQEMLDEKARSAYIGTATRTATSRPPRVARTQSRSSENSKGSTATRNPMGARGREASHSAMSRSVAARVSCPGVSSKAAGTRVATPFGPGARRICSRKPRRARTIEGHAATSQTGSSPMARADKPASSQNARSTLKEHARLPRASPPR